VLYLLNHPSHFNKIRRISWVNTPVQSLKVSLKSVLPLPNNSTFSRGLFFLLAHPVVARALVYHVFLKYCLCHVLLSDQHAEFENEILLSLSVILGVTKVRTSSYRPQSNAICQVLHRALNTVFTKCVS